MTDPVSQKSGLKRFLYGKGAILAIIAVVSPAIAAVLITTHKSAAERVTEDWANDTYGTHRLAVLNDVAARADVPSGRGVVVSSQEALRAAVEAARDGDVIRLAAGTYPQITLSKINKDGQVTITSADLARPAVITRLLIRESSGLTLSGLELAADASAAVMPRGGEEGEDGGAGQGADPSADKAPASEAEGRAERREQWLKRKAAREQAQQSGNADGARVPSMDEEAARRARKAGGEGNSTGGGGNGGGNGAGRFPFMVMNSVRITLDRLDIHGPMTDRNAAYHITALMVRGSKQIVVSNCKFHNLWNGMGMLDLDGMLVRNNEYSDIRTDGVHGGNLSNIEIVGNVFTGFHPNPGDHPDAMQLWTTPNGGVLNNILIHDNLVVRGSGSATQGVFLRDLRNQMLFHNVEIRDNLIMGSLYNGIAINNVQGARIEGNRVVNYPDRPRSWIRVDASQDVSLSNNSASAFIITRSGVKQEGNRTENPGKINERQDVAQWLGAKPGRKRADSELQARLLAGS